MGIPMLHDFNDALPDRLSAVILASRARKERLAERAGLRLPAAIKQTNASTTDTLGPKVGARCRAKVRMNHQDGEWEIRLNRAQGQLGVWVGQRHVTHTGMTGAPSWPLSFRDRHAE
eukprot:scaffold457414_cov16-Prasinocladus_malaysianus.AAC.1